MASDILLCEVCLQSPLGQLRVVCWNNKLDNQSKEKSPVNLSVGSIIFNNILRQNDILSKVIKIVFEKFQYD